MTLNSGGLSGSREPSPSGLGPSGFDPGRIDPRTLRPLGDHGTAVQALEYALDHEANFGEPEAFLRAWREGDLDEWPEFYPWLANQEAA